MKRKLLDGSDLSGEIKGIFDYAKYYLELENNESDYISYSYEGSDYKISVSFKGLNDLLDKLEIEVDSFEEYTNVSVDDTYETIRDYESLYEDYLESKVPRTLGEVNVTSDEIPVFVELWT